MWSGGGAHWSHGEGRRGRWRGERTETDREKTEKRKSEIGVKPQVYVSLTVG